MRKRQIFLIALGVIALHGLGIWALANAKMPAGRPAAASRPQDEFRQRTITYVDPAGQAQRIVQEFIVSTRLSGDTSPDGSSSPVARP